MVVKHLILLPLDNMEPINYNELEAEVLASEAKVLYDMYKATNILSDKVATIESYAKGPAQLIISGSTLTLQYADGSTSTYTEG